MFHPLLFLISETIQYRGGDGAMIYSIYEASPLSSQGCARWPQVSHQLTIRAWPLTRPLFFDPSVHQSARDLHSTKHRASLSIKCEAEEGRSKTKGEFAFPPRLIACHVLYTNLYIWLKYCFHSRQLGVQYCCCFGDPCVCTSNSRGWASSFSLWSKWEKLKEKEGLCPCEKLCYDTSAQEVPARSAADAL